MVRQAISICLMVCLAWISSAYQVSAAEANPADHRALLKQKVDLFGVGANVKVRLAGGEKLKGFISSIDDGGFALTAENGGENHQVPYDQVSELTLLIKKYRASGTPDPAEVRRVVAALGAGKHIMVRTTPGSIHGQIVAVERDYFTILPDDQDIPVQVAYGDVRQVGKNFGILSTIGLVVLIIAVIAIVSWTR